MGDQPRRLYSALPQDIERIWILSHNAKQLKDDIKTLRENVQKYRDNALLAWEKAETKGHFDKWGVPCTTPASGGLNPRANNVLEIPLKEDNPDVQVVMSVSPRKAIVQTCFADNRDVIKNKDSSITGCHSESKQSFEKILSQENSTQDNGKPSTSNEKETNRVVSISHGPSEPMEISTRQEVTSEARNGDDVIRVQVEASAKIEASAKTRNHVKILFGENDFDTKECTKITTGSQGLPSEHKEKEQENVSAKGNGKKRKLSKRKNKTKGKKPKEKLSTKTVQNRQTKKHPEGVGLKCEPKQNDGRANVRQNTCNEDQTTDYKPVPDKEEGNPNLNPGIACYPTDKAKDKNRNKGVLNKKRKKKRSQIEDLNDSQLCTKSSKASCKYIEYSTIVQISPVHTTANFASSKLGTDKAEVNKGAVHLSSKTERDDNMQRSRIEIKFPEAGENSNPVTRHPNSRKPLFKQLLELDNASQVCDEFSKGHGTANHRSAATEKKTQVSHKLLQPLEDTIQNSVESEEEKLKEDSTISAKANRSSRQKNVQRSSNSVGSQREVDPGDVLPKLAPDRTVHDSFLGASLRSPLKEEGLTSQTENIRAEGSNKNTYSFLGAPLMSSTQHECVESVNANEVEDSNQIRRTICSSSSDTDSVTSARLGLDHSSRMRPTGQSVEDFKQTVPIRSTQSNYFQNERVDWTKLSNDTEPGIVENLESVRNKKKREKCDQINEDIDTNSAVARKKDARYTTLKHEDSMLRDLCSEMSHGSTDNQSASDLSRREFDKNTTSKHYNRNHRPKQYTDVKHGTNMSKYSSSSDSFESIAQEVGNQSELGVRIAQKAIIQRKQKDCEGSPKHSNNSKINTVNVDLSLTGFKPLLGRKKETQDYKSLKVLSQDKYRVQELEMSVNNDQVPQSRSRQYKSTNNCNSDSNGTRSIYVETSLVSPTLNSTENRPSTSDASRPASENVSKNNNRSSLKPRHSESSFSSRPECSENSDQSLARYYCRTLTRKKARRPRPTGGRYREKTEENLAELVRHYFSVRGEHS